MQTKQKIMQAALRVFLRFGFEKASMNDVVRESGFTKGGIYHHFKNKDDLFFQVIQNLLSGMEDEITKSMENITSTKGILDFYFNSIDKMKQSLSSFAGENNFAGNNYYILIFEALKRFPDLVIEMRNMYKNLQKNMEEKFAINQRKGMFRPDIDLEVISFGLSAFFEGLFLMSLICEKERFDIMIKKLSESFYALLTCNGDKNERKNTK